MTAPTDNIIVQFDSKYQEEIITKGGVKFYKDPSYAPEWHATVSGRVVSIPQKLSNNYLRGCIAPDVRVGDELAFSYLVVQDKTVTHDPSSFIVQVDSKHEKVYTNENKELLKIQFFNRKEGGGIYLDRKGELLDGMYGTRKEVEKWLSGFNIARNDTAVYANLIWDGEDYWKVDYALAIAAKRGEEIIMIGGNCLLEPPEERMVYEMAPDRQLHLITKRDQGRAKLLHIGTPLKGRPVLDVMAGDMVYFNQKFVQRYELWGQQYYILVQDRLMAKEA